MVNASTFCFDIVKSVCRKTSDDHLINNGPQQVVAVSGSTPNALRFVPLRSIGSPSLSFSQNETILKERILPLERGENVKRGSLIASIFRKFWR